MTQPYGEQFENTYTNYRNASIYSPRNSTYGNLSLNIIEYKFKNLCKLFALFEITKRLRITSAHGFMVVNLLRKLVKKCIFLSSPRYF